MIIRGIRVKNEAVPYTGTISGLNDGEFIVQLSARMGILKLPRKSLICEKEPQIGDEVKLLMSFVEMTKDQYEKEETDRL